MDIDPLERDFYNRDVIDVAQALLGKLLVRRTSEGFAVGRIVETEAYLSADDPACHATRGRTRKNASMFGPAGRAYVYSIHARYCFNVVTQGRGIPSAVLIRAAEPLAGVRTMRLRRGRETDLTTGPARLCEAMAIDRRLDGWDLTRRSRLWIGGDGSESAESPGVGVSGRIGVREPKELPLRFYLRYNPFVSGPKRLRD